MLSSVLVLAFWRYREWGRELASRRNFYSNAQTTEEELARLRLWKENYERNYWLPMKVYEWTSWDEDGTFDPRQIEAQGHYSSHRRTREIGSNK